MSARDDILNHIKELKTEGKTYAEVQWTRNIRRKDGKLLAVDEGTAGRISGLKRISKANLEITVDRIMADLKEHNAEVAYIDSECGYTSFTGRFKVELHGGKQ